MPGAPSSDAVKRALDTLDPADPVSAVSDHAHSCTQIALFGVASGGHLGNQIAEHNQRRIRRGAIAC